MNIIDYFENGKLQYIHCHSEEQVAMIFEAWGQNRLQPMNEDLLKKVKKEVLPDIYVYADENYFFFSDIASIKKEDAQLKRAKKEKLNLGFLVKRFGECAFPLAKIDLDFDNRIVDFTDIQFGLYIDCSVEAQRTLRGVAEIYNTTPECIIKQFVEDLTASNCSGGSDERVLADAWLHRSKYNF